MADPLNAAVLHLLEQTTGLGDAEAWHNVWLLISKGEHGNEGPEKAFLTDSGESVLHYAEALDYDCGDRGVTLGVVGWATACDGRDGEGDAPALFKIYASLGGEDLTLFCKGCTKSGDARAQLITKIKSLKSDPRWVQAQWQQLVTPSEDGAYIFHTMQAWKKAGVQRPSALAIATVLDCSLNQGHDGEDGGCANLVELAVKGDENTTLEHFNAWRRRVAGTNDYNSPPANGVSRADMFEALRRARVFSLSGPEARKAIQLAICWRML